MIATPQFTYIAMKSRRTLYMYVEFNKTSTIEHKCVGIYRMV